MVSVKTGTVVSQTDLTLPSRKTEPARRTDRYWGEDLTGRHGEGIWKRRGMGK